MDGGKGERERENERIKRVMRVFYCEVLLRVVALRKKTIPTVG